MKKLLACLLAFLMVLTVAPIGALAESNTPEIISNIKISNVNIDLKAGHVPDVTGSLDKALNGKVEFTVHGWIYEPEEALPRDDPYEPPYYYWFNVDEYNKMFPKKNLKTISAGGQYAYLLQFRIHETDKYDFSNDLTITINGKTYTKDNAMIHVLHNASYTENPEEAEQGTATIKHAHIAHILIPVTAVKRADGWQKSGGKWYYIKNNKEFTGWQKLKGVWYYLTPSMATFWKKISGKWYYFNSAGAMQTGWQKLGGKWYYFNASGAMLTGWQKLGSKWYYFNSSGDMKTGWLKSGGKWYYLDSSGAMVAGRSLKIGKKTYKFNSSGVCTNP